jgi:hypothetical protein
MIGKIFISYARADKSFATKLARLLRREGFDLWIDQDIRAGSRWDSEIQAALTSAAIVLVILSPASVSSENVLDEVAYALDNGKPVVPLRLQQCNVPLRLTRLQHIDFQGDFDTAFRYCLDELRHRLLQTTEVDARPALSGPATEPRPDAGGVLRIIRYSKYRDRIRRYELYANGKKLGDIANNTQTDFAVPAGQLSIEARIDWCGSKPLVLQIGSNQRLDVEVVNETSLWSFPFVLLFDWSNYLALKPMRSEWAHALGGRPALGTGAGELPVPTIQP